MTTSCVKHVCTTYNPWENQTPLSAARRKNSGLSSRTKNPTDVSKELLELELSAVDDWNDAVDASEIRLTSWRVGFTLKKIGYLHIYLPISTGAGSSFHQRYLKNTTQVSNQHFLYPNLFTESEGHSFGMIAFFDNSLTRFHFGCEY